MQKQCKDRTLGNLNSDRYMTFLSMTNQAGEGNNLILGIILAVLVALLIIVLVFIVPNRIAPQQPGSGIQNAPLLNAPPQNGIPLQPSTTTPLRPSGTSTPSF